MGIKSVLLILIIYFSYCYTAQKKCRILSLEGGGDRGAYQAGALKTFLDKLPPEEIQYDIYSGISAGTLNSAGLSFFKKGDEAYSTNFLLSTWRNITGHKSIYDNWNFLSVFYSFFFEPGLFDTSPLRALLKSIIDSHEIQRNFTFGMTNLGTGGYEFFTDEHLKNMSKTDDMLAILSSSAIPVFFPHIYFRNNTYVDGGLSAPVDTTTGISICRNNGFNDEDIVLDIIMLSNADLPEEDPSKLHPISVLGRAAELVYNDIFFRNLDELGHVFPNVKIRYLVIPSKLLASGRLPIFFEPSEIEDMIQQGITDAEKVISKGEGVAYREFMDKHLLMRYKWQFESESNRSVKKTKFLQE